MPVSHLVGAPVTGRYKPSLTHQVLRRCEACHHPHPLAMKPVPLDTDHCPRCGGAVAAPAAPVDVPEVRARWVWLANLHHVLAEIVLGLAKRI